MSEGDASSPVINNMVGGDADGGGNDESLAVEDVMCPLCGFEVTTRHHGLQCDDCQKWLHQKCMKMTPN